MLFFVPIDGGSAVNGHEFGPLKLSFSVRSRYEVRNETDFGNTPDAENTIWQNRGRIGFDYDTGSENSLFRVTYQYTTTNIDNGVTDVDVTSKDITEAYFQNNWDGGSFKLGRQSVKVGSGRLVGTNEWGELGRYWNGARFDDGKWDFFAGRLDVDNFGAGNEYLAFVNKWCYTGGETTLFYAWNYSGRSLYTFDHVFSRDYDRFTLKAEAAWQWGRENNSRVEAWAGSIKGKFRLSDKLTFSGGYDTASGGTDGTTSNTFNDLHPNDHRSLGAMDMQGWSNVNALSFGFGYQMSEDMRLRLSYHDFKLNDSTGAWMNARNGTSYGYQDGTGASGDDIGNEIDLNLMWRLQNNMKLSAGFSIFDPGSFVESQSGGTENQTWFYGSLGWRF